MINKINVLDYIPFGINNAITAKELSKLLGKNERDITRNIHYLRKTGEFITAVHAGESQGYFRPTNDYEVLMFVKDMSSRIRNMEQARQPALDYLTGKTARKNVLTSEVFEYYEDLL